MIRAGFANVDITPEIGRPLGRLFINVLIPERVRWPLTARIAVFDDGEKQFAVVGLDLAITVKPAVAEIRRAVAAGTSLEQKNILVACSHTHNGPAAWDWRPDEGGFEFLTTLQDRVCDGVSLALAQLTEVELTAGSIEAPGWCYNRRPVYRGTDGGEHVGTHGPRGGDHFLRMEGPEDNQLQAVLCRDALGTPVGGLVNFACHPTNMYNVAAWSADYIGPLTDSLTDEYGCPFVFLNGCSGNLSQNSGIVGKEREGGEAYCEMMGNGLAAKAIEALSAGRPVGATDIAVASEEVPIAQRRPTKEMIDLALWYLEQEPGQVDQEEFTYRMYGHPYTMYHNSPSFQEWIARETLGMWEWQRRAGSRELHEDVEIQALRLGDIAVACVPCEYFSEFGLEIKDKSPFANTMVVHLANGWHGYIPTREGMAHGGYEGRFAYQSRLVPEAGDMMRDKALELLHRLR